MKSELNRNRKIILISMLKMKGAKVDSAGGIPLNQNRKIINKFNLNTENIGVCEFFRSRHYSNCGELWQYGDGTVDKCKSIVTSLYPAAVKGKMTNMQKNIENWKTLNLKYFSVDKNTTAGARRRHFVAEDGKTCDKLIDRDTSGEVDTEAAVISHCENHYRRNFATTNFDLKGKGEKWKIYGDYDERKGIRRRRRRRHRYLLEGRPESDKNETKFHKLVGVPCENYFFSESKWNAGRRAVCDECCAEKELTDNVVHGLFNIHTIEETPSHYTYEPYMLIPKHIYCLNQQSRRRKSDEGDPYFKTPPIDVSVETSLTNFKDQLKDEDLLEELRRRRLELPEMEGHKMEIVENQDKEVAEVKAQQETFSEPTDSADDRLRLEKKTSFLPGDGIQGSDVPFDKDDKSKPPFVQEIKYYEGNLNIFSGEDKKESPFLKITKTVTFEKERAGKQSEKTLGIDSWMQTDGDSNDSEKESNLSYGSTKNSNKGAAANMLPSLNDSSFVETAKVCGECLNLLARKYGGEGMLPRNFPNPEPEKLQGARLDKSTSIDKRGRNVTGTELIKNDFVRFIAELFLEAIPMEIYNRIMGGSERLNDEEYEVRVKSYDRGSTESCNLKTCKMRNADGKSGGRTLKEVPESERPGGNPGNECTCSDPMCNSNDGRRKRASPEAEGRRPNPPTPKQTLETAKKEDDNTYDCQITLNGRKILVKVNKSVEDLLLSGNIRNILRVPPNESFNTPNVKSKQSVPPKKQEEKTSDSGKTKAAGNCTCAEDVLNDVRKESVSGKSGINREKIYGTQRNSTVGAVRRGDSFTTIETGNYQKKGSNDFMQSGRNAKPLLTSPPPYASDGRKSDKSRNHEKNVVFDNSKSLFWSNVQVLNKCNDESDRILKGKKMKGCDYDSHNRMRSRVEYPYKVFSDRRQSCGQEKSKRTHASGNGKQGEECFPLYWESQYLKYCDQIVSEDGGCTEKADTCKSNMRDGKACNFVHEIEKRVMVTPTFGQCNAIDTPRPLCIIKISDNENCDNGQYRDYTVANVTSLKLNSNPFDAEAITCRKCIETLRSCSKPINTNWTDDKQYTNYGDVGLCDYYWNGITGKRSGESVYCEGVKGDERSTSKSDATLPPDGYYDVVSVAPSATYRQNGNSCCSNEQCYSSKDAITCNSDERRFLGCESSNPQVSCRKLHGICFSVSRVTQQETPNVDQVTDEHSTQLKTKHVGVSTTSGRNSIKENEMKLETKSSFTQTTVVCSCGGDEKKTRLEKQSSCLYFSVLRSGSKNSATKGKASSDSGDGSKVTRREVPPEVAPPISTASNHANTASSETFRSDVNPIQVLLKKEDISPSEDSIHVERREIVEKSSERNKLKRKKSWKWWSFWKRKDKAQ